MDMKHFFDPNDIEHIKAYQYLCTHGKWPDNFIPETINPLSYYNDLLKIDQKMILCWINHMYKENLR